MRVAALLPLLMPGAALAGSWTCDLTAACDGWFCADRQARATLALDDDGVGTLTLSGTHLDPDRMLRLPPRERTMVARRVDWQGDLGATFGDAGTIGVLSIGHAQRADLSLHIDGADHDYAERYTGFCEAVR